MKTKGEFGVDTHGERIRGIEVELEEVKRGVANFRTFQLENRQFMGEFRAQRAVDIERDKRRSKIHFSLLTLLIGLIIALFSFLLNHFDGRRSALVRPSSDVALLYRAPGGGWDVGTASNTD